MILQRLKLLLFSFILFSSCSSSWHLKKAIKKDPSLLVKDTLTIHDTVRTYTERTEVDSVFMISNDTVLIEKNNITIRHWIHQDSVFIEGECDSIFVEVPRILKVPVDKVVYHEDNFVLKYLPWILTGLIVFIFVRYRRE